MLRFLVSSMLLLILSSCETKFDFPDYPSPLPECHPPDCVRLALVLGGGGAKGVSHVGVLAEFEKAGIPIDLIVGCSAGSVVGALYADCLDATHVKKILKPLRTWDILDVNIWFARYGLASGGALRRYLNKHLTCKCFEELQTPLCVVATDLLSGELVTLNSGPIIPAVHASAAIPFVFSPVHLHERWLVDGGSANPVPVEVAKKMGADIVIAVDLSCLLQKKVPTHLFGVASRSTEIFLLKQSESCLRGADIILRPTLRLSNISMFDDKNHENVYQAGCKAAREAIPQIKSLLAQKGILL